jgi:hypothetical protein
MSKKKVVAGIAIVAIICVAFGIYFRPENDLREQYPYSGYSTLSNEELLAKEPSLDRAAFPTDISIEEVISMKRNCVIVSGMFLEGKDNASVKDVVILPEKDTPEYRMLEDTAESFDKEILDVAPVRATHYIKFAVKEVISGACEDKEITVSIANLGFELYPNVKPGTQAILLLTHAEDGYYNYSYEFFYLTEDNLVLSAEKYESLDKYSGTKYEDFVNTLTVLSAEYAKK